MYNLLKSDVYKLKYSKELRLSIMIVILFEMINMMTQSGGTGKAYLTREFTDWGAIIGCTLFAGMFIGRDFSNRTIYHSITIGKSRLMISISKYMTFLIGCTGIILVNLIIAGGVCSLIHGWGEPISQSEVIFILRYASIHLILNLCIASIPFLIAILIKDTGMATAIACVIMGGFVAFTNTFWNGIAMNVSYGMFDMSDNLNRLIILIVLIPIAVLGSTMLVFNKQDL